VWRLIVLEFWERFSYYGLMAILVLFLTAPTGDGGFGWTDSEALNALSLFSAAAFVLPGAGGWLADRFIGPSRSVLIGAGLLLLGNLLITAVAAATALGRAIGPSAQSGLLYGSLLVIALGNGFFKSPLITLIGNQFAAAEQARDQAFRYYYQGIMLGTLASSLSVAATAERWGWWLGFSLAAIGMAVSFAIFLTLINAGPKEPTATTTDGPSRTSTVSLPAIGFLAAFLPLLAIGWTQFYGLWILETQRMVDRTVGTFTMPSGWLLAVNALAVVVLAPLVGRWWTRLGRGKRPPPGIVAKFATAMVVMAAAHALMAVGFAGAQPGTVSVFWPVGCVLLITVGEVIFWPSTYAAIHALSPPRAKSFVMGAWLAVLGIGLGITHQVARLAEQVGFPPLSVGIAAALLAGAVCIVWLSRRFPVLRNV
jgi:POT family proton-dependent oligopeptide transporter